MEYPWPQFPWIIYQQTTAPDNTSNHILTHLWTLVSFKQSPVCHCYIHVLRSRIYFGNSTITLWHDVWNDRVYSWAYSFTPFLGAHTRGAHITGIINFWADASNRATGNNLKLCANIRVNIIQHLLGRSPRRICIFKRPANNPTSIGAHSKAHSAWLWTTCLNIIWSSVINRAWLCMPIASVGVNVNKAHIRRIALKVLRVMDRIKYQTITTEHIRTKPRWAHIRWNVWGGFENPPQNYEQGSTSNSHCHTHKS